MGKSRIIPTFLILAVLASLGWAGIYAYDKGLTKRWRNLIMEELSRRGIEAEIEKLTFDPFEGLVARNVRIYEDEEHENVLATINNITLDIDLARLVKKEQFLNTIDLRDADISFPIDPKKPKGERIEISNFSARIQMPDDTIDIQRAEFEIGGLIVNLRGALTQPTPRSSTKTKEYSPEETRQQRVFVSDLIKEIKKFEVAAGKPQLEVEIFGDLDRPEEIEAKLQLRAAEITRRKYSCDLLEADIEFKYPEIVLDRLLIKDQFGELHGHAQHSIGGDSVSFDVESTIDSHTLLRSILDNPAFAEVEFLDPPQLQMEGEYFINEVPMPGRPPIRVFGSARCERFDSRGVEFESFHVDFAVDREKLFFRNLFLEHETGNADATVLFDGDKGMRYKATVDLSPKIFSLFIDNEIAKDMIDRFSFDRSPNFLIEFEGYGPAKDRNTWITSGSVSASDFKYRGTPVKNVFTYFALEDNVLDFTNFRLDRAEGFLTGDLASIDSNRMIATIEGVSGTIDPVGTTLYFAPHVSEKLKQYDFSQPPTVTLDGDIGLEKDADHDFTVTFKSRHDARYTFLDKSLPIVAPDGKVEITGEELDLDLKAKLFEGDVHVTGKFDLSENGTAFTSTVAIRKIDFGQLAETYELKTSSQGHFTGNATIAGNIGSLESIIANGSAVIHDGNVFAIPVLGPLSKMIDLMMPKKRQAGYSIASEASAKLYLSEGKLRAEEFNALAGGFNLVGGGTVDLIADDIDFDVQMNLRGAPGVVLYPVSRLFKYKGEGPIADPTWRPVNFSLPRGDGPGLLGGPGILPRGESGEGAGVERPGILENGLPIVRPLRKGITKGVVKGVTKGGKVIKSGGGKIIKTGGDALKTGGDALKTGGDAILNTGEKILGKEDEKKEELEGLKPPKAVPVEE